MEMTGLMYLKKKREALNDEQGLEIIRRIKKICR